MRRRSGYPELIAAGLIWGSIGVVVKQLTVPAPAIVFFRLGIGAVVVVAWFAARGRLAALRLGPRRGTMVLLGVVLAVHWVLLFEAFKRLDVATTILVVYLGPVLIALGAPLVVAERIERRTIGALALSVGGIALIALPGIGDLDAVGLGLALLAAVGFAVLVLYGKVMTEHYEPPALVAWQLGIAAIVCSPGVLGTTPGEVARAWPGLLLLGVAETGIAGILYFRALRAVKAQHVGILAYLEPVSAVFYAWAFLGEVPAGLTLAGGALIVVAGVSIVLRRAPAVEAGAGALPEPVAVREATA